jgi:hypothetical protein
MKAPSQPTIAQSSGFLSTTLRKQPIVKVIRNSEKSPKIRYNEHMHLIWISGDCVGDSTCHSLINVTTLVKDHLTKHLALRVVFDLGKINRYATTALMNFFNLLKKYDRDGKEIIINWISPWEEDLYLLAFDLSELYGLKVEIRPY